MSPAVREDIRMANLEWSITSGSLKASMVTKMDMVKPIPPKIPTPNNWLQVVPFGFSASFKRIDNQLKKKSPSGFPKTSPRMIPRLAGSSKAAVQSAPIGIAVFTKANKGRMINGTG